MRFRIPKYFPGWFVSGGGGSGGAATVQTDGVTIQGDGSAGNKIAIKAVQTDATLTGAGTVASQLAIPPITIWFPEFGQLSAGQVGVTANKYSVWGFVLPNPMTVGAIWLQVLGSGGANLYDVGLYSAAGTLLVHTGAITITATGKFTTTAAVEVQAGPFFFAITGNASGALSLNGPSQVSEWAVVEGTGTTVGGALNASITPPATAFTPHQAPAFMLSST